MHKTRFALLLTLVLASCSLDGWNPYTAAMSAAPRATSPPPPATSTPTPSAALADPRAWCTVSAQVLHLRSCGSIDCAVIDWLTQGERLEIVSPGAWLKVRTESGSSGWVNSLYCEVVQ